MKVVADTHIVIWDALRPELLSEKARDTVEKANNSDGIIICGISLWEIAMMMKKKRLELEIDFLEFIRLIQASRNYTIQGINPTIAGLAVRLTSISGDPADRLICASAIELGIPLVSSDGKMRASKEVETIW